MASILEPGQVLNINDSLLSQNGGYRLLMQSDGNLVLYRTIDGKPLWSSRTNGQDTHRAIMQGDGNFVLYHADGRAAWATNTNGKNGSYLAMQNDGNLVVYWPKDPVWASGTNA